MATTASSGNLIVTGQLPFLYEGNLSAFQVINATAGTIVNVSYYD